MFFVNLPDFKRLPYVFVQHVMSCKYNHIYNYRYLSTLYEYITFILISSQISGVTFFIFTIFISWKFYMWSEFTSWESLTATKIILIISLLLFVFAVIGLCGMIRQDTHFLMLVRIIFLTIKARPHWVRLCRLTCSVPTKIGPNRWT